MQSFADEYKSGNFQFNLKKRSRWSAFQIVAENFLVHCEIVFLRACQQLISIQQLTALLAALMWAALLEVILAYCARRSVYFCWNLRRAFYKNNAVTCILSSAHLFVLFYNGFQTISRLLGLKTS